MATLAHGARGRQVHPNRAQRCPGAMHGCTELKTQSHRCNTTSALYIHTLTYLIVFSEAGDRTSARKRELVAGNAMDHPYFHMQSHQGGMDFRTQVKHMREITKPPSPQLFSSLSGAFAVVCAQNGTNEVEEAQHGATSNIH